MTESSLNMSNLNSGVNHFIISDSKKDEFNFLIKELPSKLEEALEALESTKNKEAFSISNGSFSSIYTDLTVPCEEIKNDINNLKNELSSLYKTFLNSIDNINIELESNYNISLSNQCANETTSIKNID